MMRSAILIWLLFSATAQGAIDFSESRGDYLAMSATDSPDVHTSGGGYAYVIDCKFNGSAPASDTVFAETTSPGGSYIRWIRTTTDNIRVETSNDSGTTGSVTSGSSLGTTWHRVGVGSASALGAAFVWIDDNTSEGGTGSFTDPNAALTTFWIGRGVNGATSADVSIGSVMVWDSWSTAVRDSVMTQVPDPNRSTTTATPECVLTFENSLAATTGTAEPDIGIKPTYVDDSAFYVSAGYTAPAIDAIPAITNGGLWVRNQRNDVVYVGDSHAEVFNEDRTDGLWFFNSLCRRAGLPVHKLVVGNNEGTRNQGNVANFGNASSGTIVNEQVSLDNNHEVEHATGGATIFGLPTRFVRDYFTGSAPSSTTISNVRIYDMDQGGSHEYDPNDPMHSWLGTNTRTVEPLYRHATDPNDQLPSVTLNDSANLIATVDLLTGKTAGEIESMGEHPLAIESGGVERHTLNIRPGDNDWTGKENKYLTLVSYILRVTNQSQGYGFAPLSQGSISFNDLVQTVEGDGSVKQWGDAANAQWFAHVLESGRQPWLMIRLAAENLTESQYYSVGNDIIARFDARHAASGTSAPPLKYILLDPQLHAISTDLSNGRTRIENMCRAWHQIATENPTRVIHLSGYLATGGCAFIDENTTNNLSFDANSPQAIWMANYNAANSTNGTHQFHDAISLHIDNNQGAKWLGEALAKLVIDNSSTVLLPRLVYDNRTRFSSLENGL